MFKLHLLIFFPMIVTKVLSFLCHLQKQKHVQIIFFVSDMLKILRILIFLQIA